MSPVAAAHVRHTATLLTAAIAVPICETVFIRVLLTALGMSALTALGLIMVFALRLATDLAVPEWTSILSGLLVVILMQALAAATLFSAIATRRTSSRRRNRRTT